MSRVILVCVKEGSKLRIRFDSFIDQDNKRFTNAYNAEYNCRFPRDIRQEGRFYEVPAEDVTLSKTRSAPYYQVRKHNIKIIEGDLPTKEFKIYKLEECAVCMDLPPGVTFLPCGHRCTCCECWQRIGRRCPLCRSIIHDSV